MPRVTSRLCWACVITFVVMAGDIVGPSLFGRQSVGAQDVAASDGNVGSDGDVNGGRVADEVVMGIDGHYRVGRWTPVRLPPSFSGSIQTLDGDGVRAAFDHSRPSDDASPFGYVVPGSEAALLTLVDSNSEKPPIETRFAVRGNPATGPAMIDPKMPWILVIGDPLGVEKIGANELLRRDASVAVTVPKSAESLPDQSIGYDGVDWVMINGAGISLLQDLKGSQRAALLEWIQNGGDVFLTLGKSAIELAEAAPWLIDALPIESVRTIRLNPSAVETLTTSQSRLTVFDGALLPRGEGRLLLNGRTNRRVPATIAAEYSVGIGRVVVLAADLEDEPFATWPDKMDLITKLIGESFRLKPDVAEASNRTTSFDDLAGQMRASLDRFSIKRSFGFSLLAIILMGLIAAIGPIDYLLINRVFGKPLLGWLTFPLMALGLSAVLVFQSWPRTSSSGPTQSVSEASGQKQKVNTPGAPEPVLNETIAVNQFQVIDIDSIGGNGRAFAWSYLYSHDANRFRISQKLSPMLGDVFVKSHWAHAASFGYPGRLFGGIQLAGENSLMPAYQVASKNIVRDESGGSENASGTAGVVDAVAADINGLALAPRASKSVAARFAFDVQFEDDLEMLRRPGSQLLRGGLTNPLPFDLLDGLIVYQNSVFILPKRVPAGARIESIEDLPQKNFRRRLSRQRAVDQNGT